MGNVATVPARNAPRGTWSNDSINQQVEDLVQSNHALLAEINKSRQPTFNQPQQVIKRFQPMAANDQGPWNVAGEFLLDVRNVALHHGVSNVPRMKSYVTGEYPGARRKALPGGLNETTGPDGAVLVPPEFSQQLLMRVYANDLLGRTTTFPLTTSNQLKIPAINETSRADGSRFGGVQAYWRGEGASVTRTKPQLMQVSLTVDSLTCTVQATQELLEDASGMALDTFINLVVPQELAFKIGDGIVNGSGVDQMQGVMNSPSKIAQAAEAGQAAATIVSRNIMNMWSRLHLSCWNNAVWLIDQSIIPQLMNMTVGTAGAQLAVYIPPGGLSGLPYATLMGKPVIATEFNQQLGTEGDIILTDLSTYLTATRGGLQTATSIHVLFETNELLFRFIMRLDGKSWWLSSLSPKSGGPSQSNIVTLATRS